MAAKGTEYHASILRRAGVDREGPAGPGPARLIVRGSGDSSGGYGQMTSHLMRGLEAAGIPTAFDPIGLDEARLPLDPFLRARIVAPSPPGPRLHVFTPHVAPGAGDIAFSMWESGRLPPGAAAGFNLARCVVVPCGAVAGWFRESGVTVPIRVVPLGIDPGLHRPAGPGSRRPQDAVPVRFGASGRMAHGGNRKGLEEVIAAFLDAFPADERVTLDIKCWPDCPIAAPSDPRIRLVRDSLSDLQMADWYRSLDCFVSASKGEGWGLQPHQAMACGVPVIAAIWGGHAAYMTPESCYPVEFDERPGGGRYYAGNGNWCVPRHDSLVARMREVYADSEGPRRKGDAAARRAAEFTWDRSGRELAAVVREFGLAPPAPSVGAFILTRGESTLEAAVGSVAPHVDEVVVAIDDRTGQDAEGRLAAMGFANLRHHRFVWRDRFDAAFNAAQATLGTDWTLQLDADESLDGAELVRDVAGRADVEGAEVVWCPRRHWLDLGRTREETGPYPDWQYRLRRRHVRLVGPVHPALDGPFHESRTERIAIDHFNMALYSPEEFSLRHAYYGRLAKVPGPVLPRDAIGPPGLLSMAGKLIGSAVRHVAGGGRLASPGVQDSRASACDSCPHHDPEADSCRSCGCGTIEAVAWLGLDLALKRSWASESCPLDPPRWTAEG